MVEEVMGSESVQIFSCWQVEHCVHHCRIIFFMPTQTNNFFIVWYVTKNPEWPPIGALLRV